VESGLHLSNNLVYNFFKLVALATAALEGFKNESKKMVVALVDMERAFVPPQHFIRLVQRRYA
jgi:dynamin GTPase